MNINLTLRQAQVLIGMIAGFDYIQISRIMKVSPSRVGKLKHTVMMKFKAGNYEEVISRAIRSKSVIDLTKNTSDIINWPGKSGLISIS